MNSLFEYSDALRSPIEAFYFEKPGCALPVSAHWHYFIEILYIYEGEIVVTCNNTEYRLTPGHMIFMPPQSLHQIDSPNRDCFRYAVLKFDGGHLQKTKNYLPRFSNMFLNPSHDWKLPLVFSREDFGAFDPETHIDHMVQEFHERQYGYDICLNAAVTTLMIELLRFWRHCDDYREEDYESEESDSLGNNIHTILQYIDEHSAENLSIPELAKRCGMSYSYFAKTFHRLYGQSATDYIEFIRLAKVEKLLLFTNYDLTYISEETGFSDCSHLIRIFRRKYNLTPKQYRLKYQA